MKTNRIQEMAQYIAAHGTATMEELKEHFQVSMNTVRRDVATLIQTGAAEKVYGGVCARRPDQPLTPYDVRRISKEEEKLAIGRQAAALVRDKDIIFMDSGTTTLQMIDYIKDRRELTVVTNSLGVIMAALPYDNINVIALPGQLRRRTNSFTGDETVRSLRRYNIRIAFMAATGVSTHGVTNSSPMEYEIKKCAMECSEKKVLLVAAEKFGVTGLMTFAPLDAFDTVITDQIPPQPYTQRLEEGHVELIVAE